MAINYTRLFTTLGKVVGGLNEMNSYRGATLGARADALAARFDSALQSLEDGLYPARDQSRRSFLLWVSYLQTLAASVVQGEVNLDRPMIDASLAAALVELNRQMTNDAQSLEQSPAALVVSPALTDGDTALVGTTLQANGAAAQLALPDVYQVIVPRGSQGGDTQFQEILALQGTLEAVPSTNWDWPGGSGILTNITTQDPHYNVGLTNGRLSALTGWTAAPSADWSVGAAAVAPRTGYTSSVAILTPSGASGTLTQPVTALAQTVYSWTLKVYKDAGTQTWNVIVQLVDGSGNPIAGTSSTVASSTLAAGWNTLTGFFVTPAAWTGQASFQVGYSGITASTNLQLAHAGLLAPRPLYAGGPTLVAWAGTKPATTRDRWGVTVTIGGTGALHRGLDRLLNLKSVFPYGLPVSGAATLADSLVS